MHRWSRRCLPPRGLVVPLRVDPAGLVGPTPGQARGPSWRRTSSALYVPSDVELTVEQRILEQATRLPDAGAVGGWAAMRLAGSNFCDGLGPWGQPLPVPLIVPPGRDFRAGTGAVRYRERIDGDEIVWRFGIPTTSNVRSVFDAMRWAGELRLAVGLGDTALAAALVTVAELTSYAERQPGRRGVALVKRALQLVEPRTLSPKETVLRLIWVLDAGLPRPWCNWPIADEAGQGLGRGDLLCEEWGVIGEYDGADHRSRDGHSSDVERDQLWRNAGLECFRVVGRNLYDTALVVRRMHDAVRRARDLNHPRGWLRRVDPGPL